MVVCDATKKSDKVTKKATSSRKTMTDFLMSPKKQRGTLADDLITLSEVVKWFHDDGCSHDTAVASASAATEAALFDGKPAYARAAYRYLEESPLVFYHDDADGIAMLNVLKEVLADFFKEEVL